ncbi:type I DNA topoisomerase [Christensenellaceae bacterium OttesenSCG-928-L17]|nr:type I DNA topoisomerase [Christensenellaceae bacterium OttesenSCG-928-L17]
MADNLVIVESPAKAKTIGKFLGKNYKVVASNGHVRDMPKSQLGVDVENHFQPKYITLRGRGEVLDKIRREAKNAKKIYLATDPDREGEAISWHLAQVLKLDENSKCRIVFNEITSTAVKGSLKNVRPIDMRLVDAQQARRILDRLIGYKISPILWAKVRKGLSAGRVQSVATRIICDREQEILEFVPEEYWVIAAQLLEKRSKKTFEAKFYGIDGKKTAISTEAEAQEILKRVEGAEFRATDVKVGQRTKHPSPPFTTSSLQQEASRKLGFTTKRTMLVAQQLYEGVELGKGATGLVTYIRTDSVRVANEAQEQALLHIENQYGKQYLPPKPNVFKGRASAQDAHEAIRPTMLEHAPAAIKASLTTDQYKLYKLIYERFLASQMADARYETNTITIDAAGCTFRATGVRTLFDGFTAVYIEGRDDVQEKEVVLPAIETGDVFSNKKIESTQHFTQPPPRYTEASLVRMLEEKGIGRPSTYSPTISTIIDRGYVCREKKQLVPTELGFVVTQLMKENFENIVDITFTANMEDLLDKVEQGNCEGESVLADFYPPFIETVEAASANIEKVIIPDEVSDIACEKCGAMMVYKMGRYGKFLACPNFPTCRNTKPIIEKIDVACPDCGGALIKRKSKRGKIFYGCENYPNCKFVSWDKPVAERCPKCQSLMVQKMSQKGSYVTCTNKECGYIPRKKEKEDAE